MLDCLEFNLKFQQQNPSFVIYYNGNHAISLEEDALPPMNYLTLDAYGEEHFISSFSPSDSTKELLSKYFSSISL